MILEHSTHLLYSAYKYELWLYPLLKVISCKTAHIRFIEIPSNDYICLSCLGWLHPTI